MRSVCWTCGAPAADLRLYACPTCGGTLLADYEAIDASIWTDAAQPGIWKYRRLLPEVPEQHRLYLGEGQTGLVKSRAIAARLGVDELYFKLEGGNPTGSYKDRIAAVGMSLAAAHSREACIGTTSGNAGAAYAAYAARAGIPYHLYVLEHMAEAKLAQLLVYGADVRKVKRFGTAPEVGDLVFAHVMQAVEERGWESTITAFRYNPYAMEGVKTIAFELAEQLGEPPAAVYVPAGGAGLYVGIWKGFDELHRFGVLRSKPQLVAVQSEGCANIAAAFAAGKAEPAPGASTSRISGLQVPNPPDGTLALGIMARGDGKALAVSDHAIWEAQRMLAEEEGVFCEPAGAVALAGLLRETQLTGRSPAERCVCIVSGVGFKDGQRLLDMAADKTVPLLEAERLGVD